MTFHPLIKDYVNGTVPAKHSYEMTAAAFDEILAAKKSNRDDIIKKAFRKWQREFKYYPYKARPSTSVHDAYKHSQIKRYWKTLKSKKDQNKPAPIEMNRESKNFFNLFIIWEKQLANLGGLELSSAPVRPAPKNVEVVE